MMQKMVKLMRANLDCTSSKSSKRHEATFPHTQEIKPVTHPHHLEEVHDGDQVQQGEAKDHCLTAVHVEPSEGETVDWQIQAHYHHH